MLSLVLKFKRYCSLTCLPWLEFITANRAEPQGELLDMHWQEETVTAWKSACINAPEELKSGWRMHFPAMPKGDQSLWFLFATWLEGQQFLFFYFFFLLSSARACLSCPPFSYTHRGIIQMRNNNAQASKFPAGQLICVCVCILRRQNFFPSKNRTVVKWFLQVLLFWHI